ncbi:endonuclease/exonuclease/phosphatase family protein [Herbiconiux sp.]|uniref:endonuclease/exonuclease/phosphatase family protein n=1 Tax=Herbiconiux sp. TaxID=1871186 RepID=UPI0025C56EE4|nr:endonuclease/exonuclease/phosphatase family protein [Herbiconiux sp.]
MTDPALIAPVAAPELHVATVNIRLRLGMRPRSADRWSVRAPALATLLATERPHLIGTQEVLPDQARVLKTALGEDYRRIGYGRDADGQGEGCPIYYDGTRLELLSWSQQALSDTPDEPGSTSWGNRTPRIVVAAEFRDRATATSFLAVNTHFDNSSRGSRLRAAEAVRVLVAGQGLPAVVTGDLNSGEGTTTLQVLLSLGELQDAWVAARTRLTPEWGTFPNYRRPRLGRKRIDWIVVTPDVTVERIGINTRRPGGVWPSDHLPVQAVLRFPAAAAPAAGPSASL